MSTPAPLRAGAESSDVRVGYLRPDQVSAGLLAEGLTWLPGREGWMPFLFSLGNTDVCSSVLGLILTSQGNPQVSSEGRPQEDNRVTGERAVMQLVKFLRESLQAGEIDVETY